MNSQMFERIASEKNMDTVHSIEFFVAMAIVISVVGFVFFAAA